MLKHIAVTSVLAAALLVWHPAGYYAAKVPRAEAPAYIPDGSLVAPTHYREWIFLTSGIDMSYASSAATDHHVFNNVFVNPTSYKVFLTTGTWPDGTTFMLENRGADSPVSINKRGHTQSVLVMGNEIHVKDHGKWLFYNLEPNAPAAKVFAPTATCYSCHENHAAVDTTFVQFYPTLLPIAEQKDKLSANYLKDVEDGKRTPPLPAGPTASPAATSPAHAATTAPTQK